MYKVVSLSPLPEGVVRGFFEEYTAGKGVDVSVVVAHTQDRDALARELGDADFVIGDYTFKVPIDAQLVSSMKNVKLIQQPSTGYDHIDIAACREKGIPVSNIGGANAVSVAEHTIALALVVSKRILAAHAKLLQGEWLQGELMNQASELSGKKWGVVGMGRIGREVASRAEALGMDVVYTDLKPVEPEAADTFRPLQKLLSESDVVSIHVPLTDKTKRMIGERELRLMRPSSVFVNTARGELVDEEALARAVTEGWIAGAGVDVFSREPPGQESPLVKAAREGANVVLTPHTAGATNESRLRIIQTTVENVVRVMRGEKPENVVNA
jgi:phosphoglycerate dehydrogenase-like enzyme